MHLVKSFSELIKVRPDVRDGTLDQSAYAASLGDVVGIVDKPAAREYRDPEQFREMTYETDGMKRVLENIRIRLQDGKGNGARQLETSFGGGKTHAMIAMYHKCRDWNAIPVVIDGQSMDVQNTIWGEIERQLDGKTTIPGQVAPSGDQIYGLLSNRDRPILILIDEIFNYIAAAMGVIVGNSDLAAQTITFMQRLSGQLGSLPNVCLVVSLSNRDDVLNADTKAAKTQTEYYEKLRNIIGRHRQMDQVSDNRDVSHIIRRRLFSTKENLIEHEARDIIQYCVTQMKNGGSLSADEAEDYRERFGNTYPFTPDVIDVLNNRWGAYPTFQRTRGVLRLLSLVVHSLLESGRSWISPGDIDLSVDSIRRELLQHTGDNAESVITGDITGSNALAKGAGSKGVRCASSIFMYSFPPKDGNGATYAEIKRAAFTYNITHHTVGDTIGWLLRNLFHLDPTDSNVLRFDIKPNLNHMIDQAKRSVSDRAVHDEERKILDGAIDGGKFVDVMVWPDETQAHVVQDRPVLQLVICKKDDVQWCANVVNGTSKSRRINMNGLIFLLPSDGMALGDLLRLYLGLLAVQQRLSGTIEYTKSARSFLQDEIKRAKQGIGDVLLKKYSAVYTPQKGGGVRKIRDYVFNPATDSGKPLDHLLWDRMVYEDHIAVGMAPDIAKQYGEDADTAYDTMMRTPGNVMPASLGVVRKAFEVTKPPPGVGGADDEIPGPEPPGPEPPGPEPPIVKRKPEVMHERMVYSNVVDAYGLDTLRSLLLDTPNLNLTVFDGRVKMRPDGRYEVRLEMGGKIPDRIVSNIDPEHVETDSGWEE